MWLLIIPLMPFGLLLLGIFPTALKPIKMVRPTLKKPNEKSSDDYRPISLVSTLLSKVFEKAVMLNRLNRL